MMETVQSHLQHKLTSTLETHHDTQRGHVCWQRARQHIAICMKADNVLATIQQCVEAARELVVAHIQTLYHAFTRM